MNKTLKFPKNFLWGSATSAHQIEGNTHNNWSEWEKQNAQKLAQTAKTKWEPWQQKKFPKMFLPENYISGSAADHFNRYEEDFDLVKSLNQQAFRLSLEWSRIEPEEGKFDQKALEHYRKVLLALKKRDILPFVTLWHWTNPVWLSEKGAELNPKFPFYFTRYAKRVFKEFQDLVPFWQTLNEPNTVIGNAYALGIWPPENKNPLNILKAFKQLAEAHNQAYEALHAISSKARVSLSSIMEFTQPEDPKSALDRFSARTFTYFCNKKFLKMTQGHHDFLSIQYYQHYLVKFPFKRTRVGKPLTDMGWGIYPKGIYHILKDLKKYNLPIYITENGLADAADENREYFIKSHLKYVHQAIKEGVDVRGYFYWSLLDNFEWDKGFWPRFGLVEVDFKTLKRTVRPSARIYAEICKNNQVNL